MWKIKSMDVIKNSYDENEDFGEWFKEVEQIADMQLDYEAAEALIALHKSGVARWPHIKVEAVDGLVVLSYRAKRDEFIPIDMRDIEEVEEIEF